MQKGLMIAMLMVVGCTSQPVTMGLMKPAALIASSDGRILPSAIEIADGEGELMVADPRTTEKFSGTYVAVPVKMGGVGHIGGLFSADPAGRPARFRGRATATAVLKGNRGGVLRVAITFRSKYPRRGFGQAVDRRGRVPALGF